MRKNRLSIHKQDRLIEYFVAGAAARTTAKLCGVNSKTAAFFFLRLRRVIVYEIEMDREAMFDGEVEVDEGCFGGHRKGQRGCGADGEILVFGVLKCGNKVYTRVIPDISEATLRSGIEGKALPYSTVYSYDRVGMTLWMLHASNAAGSTIRRRLQTTAITSTASRISGTRPNATCSDSMAFRGPISICT